MTDLDLANWLDSQARHDDEFSQRLRDAAERLRTRAELLAACDAHAAVQTHFNSCKTCYVTPTSQLVFRCDEFLRLCEEARRLRNAALQKARGEL